MVGENFEIYFSQMAKNAFKFSTMVGESFEIYLFQKVPGVFPEFSQNWKMLPEFSLNFLKTRSFPRFSRFFQTRRDHARSCAVLLYYLHGLPEIWIYVFIGSTYLINSRLILYATTSWLASVFPCDRSVNFDFVFVQYHSLVCYKFKKNIWLLF